MEYLFEYGLFLAKTITIVVGILFVAGSVISLSMRNRGGGKEEIEITRLNEKFDHMSHALVGSLLSKAELKKQKKADKKEKKKTDKEPTTEHKRVFVIEFDGDIRGTHVESLREEITAVLTVARDSDEVVVKVESPGGMVHAYGLAASQLARVKTQKIPLTICVDKVAASGGYLMACVADKILAAPFSIIGSIGVVTQIPNFSKILKKNDIEYEQITAGEYKRTLTMFGENTQKGREKLQQEVEETHGMFKDFVSSYRPDMDMNVVATGEHWLGSRAMELGLVDEILTSDDYLLESSKTADVLRVEFKPKQKLMDKISSAMGRMYTSFSAQKSIESPSQYFV
ncbi:MAG: serine protease SohB [Parasphingorhabdus sp.]|jgi:serine protease SohB